MHQGGKDDDEDDHRMYVCMYVWGSGAKDQLGDAEEALQ